MEKKFYIFILYYFQQIQMQERVDKLREEVAKMIARSTTTSSRLHLIEALERLCLDHLFEEEISATLAQIETADVSDCDLGTVALWFCLLRKHRYPVSPGIAANFFHGRISEHRH
jgi:uncharacterized UBP type Zn finger protein